MGTDIVRCDQPFLSSAVVVFAHSTTVDGDRNGYKALEPSIPLFSRCRIVSALLQRMVIGTDSYVAIIRSYLHLL